MNCIEIPKTYRETMMPLAPTPIIPVPTKPKIGFTIESLVGNGNLSNLSIDNSPPSSHDSRPSSSSSSCGDDGGGSGGGVDVGGGDSNHRMSSPFSLMRNCRDEKRPRSESPPSVSSLNHHHGHHNHHHHHHHHHHNHHRHGSSSTAAAATASSSSATSHGRSNNVRSESPPPPPSSVSPVSSPSVQFSCPQQQQQQSTIHVPTASMPQNPFLDTLTSLKGIYAPEPTYTNGMLPNLMGPHHQSMSCSPMGHVPQHSMFPGLSPLFLGNIGTVGPHQLHREAYPLYPWLLSRQGRFLGHRFQGPDAPAFLLQPFRKPKRIRTAFSPSQLLKLEHAFEKNHYVVGAERKHLAQALSLTETQVKVWFQNRRTKHKRLKQEEEQTQSSPPSPKKKGTHHLNKWKMETNQSGDENSSEAS